MSRALVEFPLPEAEALLKRTAPDGEVSMSAAECEAVEQARARIAQAVRVERGCGGSQPSLAAIAESLVGQRVRVTTSYGAVRTGILTRITGFRSIVVEDGHARHPINVSLIESIERARELEAAA